MQRGAQRAKAARRLRGAVPGQAEGRAPTGTSGQRGQNQKERLDLIWVPACSSSPHVAGHGLKFLCTQLSTTAIFSGPSRVWSA